MSERNENPTEAEDRVERRLVEMHAALVAGESSATPKTAHEDDTGVDPALDAAGDVLRLIERVRRRELDDDGSHSHTIVFSESDTPSESLAPGESSTDEFLPTKLGRFQVLRKLGQGGCGVVLLANDPDLKRPVALKVPRPEVLMTADVRARFLREAEATAALQHPHIIPVHEVGSDGALSFIVSAYCNGPTLAEWLEGHTPDLSPSVAAELTATLADAVQHAHSRGILHRDLKPGNVLLERDETNAAPDLSPQSLASAARISDFGLARIEGDERHTRTGAIVGTPSYMSPEQAEGDVRHVGPAADIYALGAILFELLTGRPPFQEAGILETLQAVRRKEPPPPRRLREEVPRDLEAICLKCLEKRPDRRYTSAAALADDLRRYLESRPVAARPVGRRERFGRWCRRNPWIASLSAAVIVALLAGIAFTTHFAIESSNNAADARDKADEAERYAGEAQQKAGAALKAQGQLEEELYYHRIALSDQEWRANNVTRARALLDACPPRLRGWEWRLLRRMMETNAAVLKGHTDRVFAVAYSRNGQVLASAGADRKVIFWNPKTLSKLGEWKPGDFVVTSLAFHPDKPYLAAAGSGGYITIGNYLERRDIHLWKGHSATVLAVDFSSDGKVLGTACERGELILWDAESHEKMRNANGTSEMGAVRFVPKGPRLVSAGKGDNREGPFIWDYDRNVYTKPVRGVGGNVFDIDVSPDAKSIATAMSNGTIIIWDNGAKTRLRTLRGDGGVFETVSYAPSTRNGGWIAAAGRDKAVWIWYQQTGDLFSVLRGHTGWVHDLAFHPKILQLATAGGDGTVRLWHPNRLQHCLSTQMFEGTSRVYHALAFSPNGRHLACGIERAPFLQIRSASSLAVEAGPMGHTQKVVAVAFAPDGNTLITSGLDKRVILWNVKTWQPRKVLRRESVAQSLAVTSDGSRLIAVETESVRVLQLKTGEPIRSIATPRASTVTTALSPDGGRLYRAGEDATVRVWDLKTGRKAGELKLAEGVRTAFLRRSDQAGRVSNRWVQNLRVDSTGGRLLVACRDGTAVLWDLNARQPIRKFVGHNGSVLTAIFSRDGRRIFTGGADGTIRIWETATGRLVLTLKSDEVSTRCLALSPDGHRLASAPGVGYLKLWDATSR